MRHAPLQQIYRRISEHALMFVIEHAGEAIGECWLQLIVSLNTLTADVQVLGA